VYVSVVDIKSFKGICYNYGCHSTAVADLYVFRRNPFLKAKTKIKGLRNLERYFFRLNIDLSALSNPLKTLPGSINSEITRPTLIGCSM